MIYLFAVSLLWAVSFGLIKGQLAGTDATAVAAVRIAVSLLVFLPLLKPRAVAAAVALRYAGIGAVQFGLMYVLYIAAYDDLAAHEIALFTILTPLWVALVDDALARRFSPWTLGAALLAVLGAGVVKWADLASPGLVRGFVLVQASNLCFAVGQVLYRRLRLRHPVPADHAVFAWLYLGAAVAAGGLSLALSRPSAFDFTGEQWGVLLYLGAVATGLGFYGWNVGATKVDTATLAVFNNLKIPLAILVSLTFFGERLDEPVRFVLGSAVMVFALVAHRLAPKRATGKM
ncbi:MAG: EamA family transporter [Deltaproteobacteria bacterium]|nr:MAG: EamA family transporter [Deltaproteobacteria bacterium]